MTPSDGRNGNSAPAGPLAGCDADSPSVRGQAATKLGQAATGERGFHCIPSVARCDKLIELASGQGGPAKGLVVMAKYWQPGRVKTRLAVTIGCDAAASLHELFTRRLTRSLDQTGDWRQVRVAPDECCNVLASEISPNWTVKPQGDGDLGQRMWRGFSDNFAAGASRVVMIGADLPTLCQADLDLAFENLHHCDLVLGPAIDGGYYLIGLRCGQEINRFSPLFGALSWGTSSVLGDTLSIAARCGLAVQQLEPREDVDHWPDLLRLVQRLERSDSSDDTALAAEIRAALPHVSCSDSFSDALDSTNPSKGRIL